MDEERFRKHLRALEAPPPAVSVEEALAILDPLPENPQTEQVQEVLGRFRELLKPMNDIARELARDGAIRKLRLLGFKCATRIVDRAMPLTKSTTERREGLLGLREPDLWPEPVEGAALLSQLEGTVRRYVALTAEQAVLFALWTLFAHAHDAFEISPILAVTSPDKGCGKSTALALLSALVPKPITSANITPSAVFRVTDYFHPTLLLDEADTFLTDSEGLRGILNSGHMRTQAYVTRVIGEDYRVCMYSTWAPKAVALIGELPATLADRSVTLRMRRRAPHESIERLQLHRLGDMEDLRSMAARWASDHTDELRILDPRIPAPITKDRARDNWRPLLAIADLAGGEWPTRARSSALVLTSSGGDTSAAVQLLEDLRSLFQSKGADRLTTEEILTHLNAMDERPWPEWRDRGPMTPRQLALILQRFGIGPTKWKHNREMCRGYDATAFEDSFSRYLPSDPPHPPPASIQSTYSPPSSATRKPKNGQISLDKSSVLLAVADQGDTKRHLEGPDQEEAPP